METPRETSLTPNLHVELFRKEVSLSRRKGLSFRIVSIPRHIIDLSFLYESAFGSLIGDDAQDRLLSSREEWELHLVKFRGRKYMSYVRINKQGERVW